MENIALKTLEEKLQELNIQRYKNNETVENQFNKNAKEIFVSIDSMFKNWNVRVGDYDIQLSHPDISSFNGAITIKFPQKQEGGKYVYTEPQLCWKGVDVDKEIELDLGIMIGIMCKTKRANNFEWGNLVSIFHMRKEAVKAVTPAYKETYVLEEEIRKIKASEYQKNIEAKLAKGKIEVEKDIRFSTGPARWDYVVGKSFEWEENKGGKTYKFWVIENESKRLVKERLKSHDLRIFLQNK